MPILRKPVSRAIPIRQLFQYNRKVVYIDEQGNEVDITEDALVYNFERRDLKYGIGGFTMVLNNNNGKYLNKINEYAIIKIYADNGSATPTNQIFRGRVDNPLYSLTEDNQHLKVLIGRDWPEVEEEMMSIAFSANQAKECFSSVVTAKFPNLLNTNNVSADMTTAINYNYVDAKPSSIFADVLKRSGHSGYINHDGNIHAFADGSRKNNNEVVSYGINLMPYSNFGKDTLNSFNKIKGYGSQKDGMLLVKTKNDLAAQQASYVKATQINESTIEDTDELDEKVQSELSFNAAIIKGNLIASNGLFSLQPGESIRITDQYGGISGYYKIPIFSMQFNQDGSCYTYLTIEKPQASNITNIIEIEEKLKKLTINNPNSVDDTLFLLNFEDSTEIQDLGYCELSNNKLVLKSGFSTGEITTSSKTLSQEPSKYFFQLRGTQLDISTLKISLDGGLIFNPAANLEGEKDTKITLANKGKKAIIKITLRSNSTYSNPQLEIISIGVEY